MIVLQQLLTDLKPSNFQVEEDFFVCFALLSTKAKPSAGKPAVLSFW